MRAETKRTLYLTKAEKKVLTDFYWNFHDDATSYYIFSVLQQIAENKLERNSCEIKIVD